MVTRDILRQLLVEICDEAETLLLRGGPTDSDYTAAHAMQALRKAVINKLGE